MKKIKLNKYDQGYLNAMIKAISIVDKERIAARDEFRLVPSTNKIREALTLEVEEILIRKKEPRRKQPK